MNGLKKILLFLIGEKRYLSLLSASFQALYRRVSLGVDYQDVYFLESFVRAGDVCVDIGAHLGYYTFELSRLVGAQGRVYAVEPMSKFHNTLQARLKAKKVQNVTLYQYAMGGDSEFVDMGIPQVNNMKKFAYARIKKSSEWLEFVESEKVKNERGDDLFAALPRVDFIKCDVEGLEIPVFQQMLQVIARHKPVLLCELADKNERIRLSEMLGPWQYEVYILRDKKLVPIELNADQAVVSHNHYFIPASAKTRFGNLLTS